MVYFRMMPLGLAGGSQDTTTLLAEDGTAFMPAGGPGTEGGRAWQSRRQQVSEVSAQPGEAAAPCRRAGISTWRCRGAAMAFPPQHWAGASGVGSAGERSPCCLWDTSPRVALCRAGGRRVNCSPGSRLETVIGF